MIASAYLSTLNERQALRLLEISEMKKVIFIGLLATAPLSRGFAGTQREELMARMGFSKEEIAKDAATHSAVTGTLDTIPGKSDPKVAASVLRDANEINALRALSALRQQAEKLVVEANQRVALAKIRQQEAEAKAEVAVRETNKMVFNDGVSTRTFDQALDGRAKFVREAQEARDATEAEVREAAQARVTADAIIAKANADEAMIEQKRLARAVASKEH